jgi:hypothetical protein
MTNRLSRRRLLLGGGTLALLAGCGFDAAKPQPLLVNLFSTDRVLVAGRPQRVPFAVVDNKAVQLADDAELPVRILQAAKTIDTLTVQARIVNHEHVDPTINPNHQHSDLLRYFALRAIFPNPGIYDLEVDRPRSRWPCLAHRCRTWIPQPWPTLRGSTRCAPGLPNPARCTA